MVICVALAKLLGVIYIIPLTPLIQGEGLGIYQNAYSLYVIILTLATSGFPTAMGKLVSERLALHRYGDVERVYQLTMQLVLALGVVCALVTWFGAPLYSHLVAIKEPAQAASKLVWSIRALAPAVLIVPLMSALRGYLQGFQRMDASGYSQAIEQVFRVVAMIVGAYLVIRAAPGNIAGGAAAATFGAFVGALAGLVLLLFYTVPLRRSFSRQALHARPSQSNAVLRRAMVKIAIPVCMGALVVPFSNFVDSVTVQNILMFDHYSFQRATKEFGVLTREAFTLIQLPLAFAMAIGATVLPAMSAASATRNRQSIQTQISGTVRSMMFITVPTAVFYFILAKPIDELLFGETSGASIISSVAFMGIFSSLELISTYMLQGLGEMYRPVRNMLIGVLVKLVLNIALVFPFHIMGAAIATTVGYLLSSTLNILAVKKYGNVQFSVWRLTGPTLGAGLILYAALFVSNAVTVHTLTPLHLTARYYAAAQIAVPLFIGAIVYVLTAIRLRAVSAEELKSIPAIGRRLSRLARRVQPNQPVAQSGFRSR